jgi:hypothetical protein
MLHGRFRTFHVDDDNNKLCMPQPDFRIRKFHLTLWAFVRLKLRRDIFREKNSYLRLNEIIQSFFVDLFIQGVFGSRALRSCSCLLPERGADPSANMKYAANI